MSNIQLGDRNLNISNIGGNRLFRTVQLSITQHSLYFCMRVYKLVNWIMTAFVAIPKNKEKTEWNGVTYIASTMMINGLINDNCEIYSLDLTYWEGKCHFLCTTGLIAAIRGFENLISPIQVAFFLSFRQLKWFTKLVFLCFSILFFYYFLWHKNPFFWTWIRPTPSGS